MRMTTHSACINPSIIISKELKRFSHRNTLMKSKRYNVCFFVCMCVCLCACVFVCACCNCNCFMRRRCCSLVALLWTSSLHSICGTSWGGHPPCASRPTHAHMHTQQRGKGGHSMLLSFATALHTNASFPQWAFHTVTACRSPNLHTLSHWRQQLTLNTMSWQAWHFTIRSSLCRRGRNSSSNLGPAQYCPCPYQLQGEETLTHKHMAVAEHCDHERLAVGGYQQCPQKYKYIRFTILVPLAHNTLQSLML